ncbi:LPS translocon maturation chaperone LptM [Duganella fentianensis]|uniref:LPS translocon maturation chaperone LptM n=1 Tax=Duganella fentianensis TaxID=2692177 RepID=UPI003FCD1102
MKSSFRFVIGMATLCLTVLLSACGQPGPLYLPKIPPAKPAKSGDAAAAPTPPTAPQQ